MSRNSQRRKDWDDDSEQFGWKKNTKRKEKSEWFEDERYFQKRHNHRNKKKKMNY